MLFLSSLDYISLTQLEDGDIAVRLLAYNQPKTIYTVENFLVA